MVCSKLKRINSKMYKAKYGKYGIRLQKSQVFHEYCGNLKYFVNIVVSNGIAMRTNAVSHYNLRLHNSKQVQHCVSSLKQIKAAT